MKPSMTLEINGSEPKDMLISRIDRFDYEVVRWFVLKNRLRLKDLISVLARLVIKRGWLDVHSSGAWNEIDDLIKQYLKENNRERYLEFSFIDRYLGFGLQAVTKGEVKEIQRLIMIAKEGVTE